MASQNSHTQKKPCCGCRQKHWIEKNTQCIRSLLRKGGAAKAFISFLGRFFWRSPRNLQVLLRYVPESFHREFQEVEEYLRKAEETRKYAKSAYMCVCVYIHTHTYIDYTHTYRGIDDTH